MLEQNTNTARKENHDMACSVKVEPEDSDDESADDVESRGLIYDNLEIVMKEPDNPQTTIKLCTKVEAGAEECPRPSFVEVPAQCTFLDVSKHISVEIVKIEATDDEPVPGKMHDNSEDLILNKEDNEDVEETPAIKSSINSNKKRTLRHKIAAKSKRSKDYDKKNIRQYKHRDSKTKKTIVYTESDYKDTGDKLGLDLSVKNNLNNTKPHGKHILRHQ
ncbi:unnamed protein product [Arctia plantaginis]|uniref:Uncharacterized protein n=1 Tax=Arctia plantaginis TaxID=874455 RepID=A0A8S1ACJ2_ARCPL|nr:unnamed protein product [Arctia plantaginis]